MIIEEGTPIGDDVIIIDHEGWRVDKVKSFDTETLEAEVYATLMKRKESDTMKATSGPFTNVTIVEVRDEVALIGRSILVGEGRSIVTFKCHLPGCKAISKTTGQQYI